MHQINHLEPSKLPVRQKGWVKLAFGVKYFSSVARWVEGGDWVRRWIIWEISDSGREVIALVKLGAWVEGTYADLPLYEL